MASDDEMAVDIKSLTSMAKRLGLKGKAIGQYVREHMEKLGYEAEENITFRRKTGGSRNQNGGFLSGLLSGGDNTGDDD
jgi:hypothetical protein